MATKPLPGMTEDDLNPLDKTGERGHVLVADDDDALRGLLASVLKRDGYLVSLAATGEEAVGIVAAGDVDVALIDVKMPGLNGIEVLKRSKRIDPEIEAVIITGFSGAETAEDALRNGAYDFIRKPFADIKQIPRCVRRAAERRRMSQRASTLMREVSSQKRLLDEKATELRLLYELSKGIPHVLNHEKLSSHLLETLLSLTSVEACSAFLLRKSPPILIVKSRRPMSEALLAQAMELVVREASELTGQDFSANSVNVRYDHVHSNSGGDTSEPPGKVSGEWSLGVTVAGEMVCILSVLVFDDASVSPDDMRLFSRMAEHASQTIEGVRRAIDEEKAECRPR